MKQIRLVNNAPAVWTFFFGEDTGPVSDWTRISMNDWHSFDSRAKAVRAAEACGLAVSPTGVVSCQQTHETPAAYRVYIALSPTRNGVTVDVHAGDEHEAVFMAWRKLGQPDRPVIDALAGGYCINGTVYAHAWPRQ